MHSPVGAGGQDPQTPSPPPLFPTSWEMPRGGWGILPGLGRAGTQRCQAQPRGVAAVLTPEHLSDIDPAAPQGSPTAGCPPAGKRRENLPTNRAASQASRFVFFLLNKLL